MEKELHKASAEPNYDYKKATMENIEELVQGGK